jgi:transposase-like protein
LLDDLIKRGLRWPEFLIVDGASELDKAIAAVWDGVPVQRCTVHKHRNLLAHAPERLHRRSRRLRQPGGKPATVCSPSTAAKPMAQRADDECN